jgi:N-carbamoyl-L-amino-acid hydrolase
MTTVPRVDPQRLWADLMVLGEITEPDQPYTRRSFSPLFAEGRRFLTDRMVAAGLEVRVDTAGNLIGRLQGREPGLGTVALGSHSDSVRAGGRFDGMAGVVAGLEVVRAVAESGEHLRHDLEVIDFLAEEPSPFGVSCIGSRGVSGTLDEAMLALTDPQGRVLRDALRQVGGDPDRLAEAQRNDLKAFLELHIEQGPVLEKASLDIGIVTSIVGIRRIEIVFDGQAAHAGTAPMTLRRDAAVAGAATLLNVREHAEALAREPGGYFVATVGDLRVEPGGPNVVPARCRLVIDARSEDTAQMARFAALIDADSAAAAVAASVERSRFAILSDGVPALCDERLRAILSAGADRLGLSAMEIASGAGHDAAFIARVCPAAMIFIPCLNGVSHSPVEWASPDQVAKGAELMLEALTAIDAGLG